MQNEKFLNMLIRLMEKDVNTYEHSMRVGKMAQVMASYLKFNQEQTRSLVIGCLLHDIGKILIPNEILKKDSDLKAVDWEAMRLHPVLGAKMAEKEGISNQSVIEVIKFHHERWDGAGYPFGLRGNFIPTFARICAVIDAFDCMLHDRPYRKGITIEEAKRELWYQSRKQFDKKYVEVLLNIPAFNYPHSSSTADRLVYVISD
jgi:putative nucleotidyltransferase with HDIG domain